MEAPPVENCQPATNSSEDAAPQDQNNDVPELSDANGYCLVLRICFCYFTFSALLMLAETFVVCFVTPHPFLNTNCSIYGFCEMGFCLIDQESGLSPGTAVSLR